MPRHASPPVALTIAGSDCSAGAGVQADLKTLTANGVYGLSALTCVVAEVPGRVASVQPVDLAVVRQQIELSLGTYPVRAVKTGMLHSRAVVELVADLYGALDPQSRPPLVVDPVMVATSGDSLLQTDAVAAYRERLFPLAALVTPNLDEARVLLGGHPIADEAAMRAGGHVLAARHGTAFLMKGGHLRGDSAVDLLCLPGGATHEYRYPFIAGVSTHGTGCTYSAAIAAGLAHGSSLPAATARAKQYVTSAIGCAYRWTVGARQVDALRHDLAGIEWETD